MCLLYKETPMPLKVFVFCLVFQNRILVCIFMGWEAQLKYVLKTEKIISIPDVYFLLTKHTEILNILTSRTIKKIIIIPCFSCEIFQIFQHSCKILHTKIIWGSECAVQKSGFPPPMQESYLQELHFFCIIFFFWVNEYCIPFCIMSHLQVQKASPKPTASQKRRKGAWRNFK